MSNWGSVTVFAGDDDVSALIGNVCFEITSGCGVIVFQRFFERNFVAVDGFDGDFFVFNGGFPFAVALGADVAGACKDDFVSHLPVDGFRLEGEGAIAL